MVDSTILKDAELKETDFKDILLFHFPGECPNRSSDNSKINEESIYDLCKFHKSKNSSHGNMNILPRYIRNPGAKEPEDETYVNGLFVDANYKKTEDTKTIISKTNIGNIVINIGNTHTKNDISIQVLYENKKLSKNTKINKP